MARHTCLRRLQGLEKDTLSIGGCIAWRRVLYIEEGFVSERGAFSLGSQVVTKVGRYMTNILPEFIGSD
jgi:hypothetical protein